MTLLRSLAVLSGAVKYAQYEGGQDLGCGVCCGESGEGLLQVRQGAHEEPFSASQHPLLDIKEAVREGCCAALLGFLPCTV